MYASVNPSFVCEKVCVGGGGGAGGGGTGVYVKWICYPDLLSLNTYLITGANVCTCSIY